MSIFKMLTYPITTHFGEIDNFHSSPHSGIDFACPVGTPAQSVSDGTVSSVGLDPMLGETIRVKAAGAREWVYGHLSRVNVTTAQRVNSGDTLGLTGGVPGTPGAGHSTGPHIHISLLYNGKIVDPTAMLNTANNNGFWSKLGDALMNPPHVPTTMDRVLEYLGTLIHIMPEVCGLLAMVFLLVGMVGCKRAMRWAGTCVLLALVGTMVNAAIGG